MHKCNLCEYKSKYSTDVKRHKSNIHNINVKWHKCNLCEYKTKNNSDLLRHKRNLHENTEIFKCNLCDFTAKSLSNLKQHKSNIHNIDVKWYYCDLCSHKTKHPGSLKQHKAGIHNVNVKWYHCDVEWCLYKAKTNNHIVRHKKRIHSKEGKARQKRQEQRIARLLDSHNIKYEREIQVNFDCFKGKNYARIDFTLYKKDCIILLEVDENQHDNYYFYSVSCDTRRMNDIVTAIRCSGNSLPILFIRYNPDAFKVNGITERVPKIKRESKLIKFIKEYKPSKSELEIKYMYYNTIKIDDYKIPEITQDLEYNEEMVKCVL